MTERQQDQAWVEADRAAKLAAADRACHWDFLPSDPRFYQVESPPEVSRIGGHSYA